MVMELKEIERKMDDYQLQILKWIIIDAIIGIVFFRASDLVTILNIQPFRFVSVIFIVFLLSIISTYNKIDNYHLLKIIRKELDEA
jgi:hypothetical protein